MFKQVLKNIVHLSFVKGLELALPLLSIPVLIHSLGVSGYGELVYVQTVISFISVVIYFGLDDVGIKIISSAENNITRNQLAFSIYIIKLFLFLISSLIYFSCIYYIGVSNAKLYYCAFSLAIISLVDPYWFFQGIERLGIFSFASILTKAIYFISLVFMIKDSHDIYKVPLLQAMAYFIGNVPALYFMICKLKVYKKIPKTCQIIHCVTLTKYVFISNVILAIKDKTSAIILGNLVGREALAIFDLISKIIVISTVPFNIINTALFPSLSRNHDYGVIRKLAAILILVFLAMFVLSIPIIWIIIPKYIQILCDYRLCIQLSIFSGVFYGLSFLISRNIFIALGYMRELFYGVLATTSFYLALIFYVLFVFKDASVESLVFITVLTYFFEMIYRAIRAFYLEKKKLINE